MVATFSEGDAYQQHHRYAYSTMIRCLHKIDQLCIIPWAYNIIMLNAAFIQRNNYDSACMYV